MNTLMKNKFALLLGVMCLLAVTAETAERSDGAQITSVSDFAVRREGNMEVTRLQKGRSLNLADIVDDADAIIRRIHELGAPGQSMFEYDIILDQPASPSRFRRIQFVQTVRDIHLPSESSIVMQANGDVVRTRLVRWFDVIEPLINKEYAIELAEKAVADELEVGAVTVDVSSAELKYRSEETAATPYWEIQLTAHEKHMDLRFSETEAEMIKQGQPSAELIEKFKEQLTGKLYGEYRFVFVNAFSGETKLRYLSLMQ